MKRGQNRERILLAAVDLFNDAGTVAITTNHIAENLKISPGNLYFHFRNKEEIVRELFERMCKETYEVWIPDKKLDAHATPLQLIEKSYEIFWTYRFFHRELYHLRRKDPVLAKRWKAHITKCVRLLQASYHHWVKAGVMKKIEDPKEMKMIADLVLMTCSSFLQFFESPDKPATRRTLREGLEHILRLLLPYHTESHRPEVRNWLAS
ncbi:MAG TPA: TetR/AcrR family transcriptional regulator [Bdellovibrionales bacterium]|nr:TetR/AcrR family transcriptional regulator [Bdellovibrionales bacterium]